MVRICSTTSSARFAPRAAAVSHATTLSGTPAGAPAPEAFLDAPRPTLVSVLRCAKACCAASHARLHSASGAMSQPRSSAATVGQEGTRLALNASETVVLLTLVPTSTSRGPRYPATSAAARSRSANSRTSGAASASIVPNPVAAMTRSVRRRPAGRPPDTGHPPPALLGRPAVRRCPTGVRRLSWTASQAPTQEVRHQRRTIDKEPAMHQSFDHEDVSELSVALSALRLLISAGR